MGKSVVRSEDTRSGWNWDVSECRLSCLNSFVLPFIFAVTGQHLAHKGIDWNLADPGLQLHQGSTFDWQLATQWPIWGRRLESFVLTQRDKAGDPAVPLATGHDTVEPADTPHSHLTTTTKHNPPGSQNISNCVCLEPRRSAGDSRDSCPI